MGGIPEGQQGGVTPITTEKIKKTPAQNMTIVGSQSLASTAFSQKSVDFIRKKEYN
jgi:hypothetical protein